MSETHTSGRAPPTLRRMLELGQSPWLDFIQRSLVSDGELQRMIREWGLRGITSNPVIFEKAIVRTSEYDEDIATLARAGYDAGRIYETLAMADVAAAADLLRPVHRDSGGRDGFASLEVSPHLAHDADATVDEARRLWAALDRPNVMIKVPATDAGLDALRRLLADGININVTLLFAVPRYRQVLEAWMDGIEAAMRAGRPAGSIASVASFFLSRIDARLDPQLDHIADGGGPRALDAAALRGQVAIASARVAYAVFASARATPRMQALESAGAQPQRLLWASTGTKDPAYADTRYVDALVAQGTVNTLPLETLRAFVDHGDPQPMPDDPRRAAMVLEQLEAAGIPLDRETGALLVEGVEKFIKPFDALLASVEEARQRALRSGA